MKERYPFFKHVMSVGVLFFANERSDKLDVQGTVINEKCGKGNIVVTGNVGDVAKEVPILVKTLLQQTTPGFTKRDYHIHFTYPTVRKDGVSWGLACYVLLGFLAKKFRYIPDIAATGEIDLLGDVRPVNNINHKMLAWAKRESGTLLLPVVENVTLPKDAIPLRNIQEIPQVLKKLDKKAGIP